MWVCWWDLVIECQYLYVSLKERVESVIELCTGDERELTLTYGQNAETLGEACVVCEGVVCSTFEAASEGTMRDNAFHAAGMIVVTE